VDIGTLVLVTNVFNVRLWYVYSGYLAVTISFNYLIQLKYLRLLNKIVKPDFIFLESVFSLILCTVLLVP
jgi:hypothetical protein